MSRSAITQEASDLGARIRRSRLVANLTQAQLAAMVGVSLSGIRRLESNGQGTIDLLVRVAAALQADAPLAQLFAPAPPSIAQAEMAAALPPRQRARQRRLRALSDMSGR